MSELGQVVGGQHADSVADSGRWTPPFGTAKGRILVVEDEEVVRDAMGPLLAEEGYEVWCAENGREALRRLRTNRLPDLIVLDLRMPVMDGWEFRTIQKDDPVLGHIPVVAVSADCSAQAAAISAQAFLRKPLETEKFLATIGRILHEDEHQKSILFQDTEWLASLGRLAANVGHELNNPLGIVLLNLNHSLEALQPSIRSHEASHRMSPPEVELEDSKGRSVGRAAPFRGRILVIDDEPFVGRLIRSTLKSEHDVFVVHSASEAVSRFESGETFDLVLCDLALPDLSGPEFYATIARCWPQLLTRLVSMTGGGLTLEAVELMERVPMRALSKPFKIDRLKELVRERLTVRLTEYSNG